MPRIATLCLLLAGLAALVSAAAQAATPKTAPPPGLRDKTPTIHALIGAKIVVAPGKVLERATLVLRDGVITAIGPDAPLPAGARVHDLTGKTIYPGLFDSCVSAPSTTGDSAGSEQGAAYWNNLVRPERRLDLAYRSDEKANESLRSQGITVRLLAPSGRIVHGTSALVTTGDGSPGETIVRDQAALHLRLTTDRKFHDPHYPNSPMGALTLVRQALYDARWYAQAWEAYESNSKLPRPERNVALAALGPFIGGKAPVVIEAADNLFLLRAAQVAREFDLQLVIRGSGEEYQLLDAVKEVGRPVIVPLDFPKPPDVTTPEKARSVSLARLLHWDTAPENPARLAAAGVKIAFTTQGLKEVSGFLPAIRRAVRRGLDRDAALRALTTTPAELWDVADRLGTLEVGKAAHLVVTDGDLFEEKTKLLETWVDGTRYEIGSRRAGDLRGDWAVTVEQPSGEKENLVVTLVGEPEKVTGTVRRGKRETKLSHLSVDGPWISATAEGDKLGWEGILQWSATVGQAGTPTDLSKPADRWTGSIVWADGRQTPLTARRLATKDKSRVDKRPAAKDDKPKEKEKVIAKSDAKPAGKAAADKKSDEKKSDEKKDDEKKDDEPLDSKPKKPLIDVRYPFGDFGRTTRQPPQPQAVVFRNATIWTCGPDGNLADASVLVEAGKIVAVGRDLKVPKDALEIDCRGGHVTPGLIDCHSHIATDGGVNEGGQTITAEVRIGDFIDPNDINIYRQLAGGVTAVHVLHGSANTIGGQSQVIKLRWGALPEEMKFTEALPTIKFALGENVKQSNWGDNFHTRYPQSRMGVEQLVRDAFRSAAEYRRRWNDWRRAKTGLPPRVDLELEAVAEVLEGKRWIHCHAYRQDEILGLMHLCDEFHVRVSTFQHILEGYKVADALVRHGATGSSFSDWWAYKFEVLDAIPYNGALMREAGVVVSFNSDDAELARRLNLEAAKAIKYGGVPEIDALKFVTLNPARQLGIDRHVGSIEVGKQADLVLWSKSPLSTYTRCERTWVDGREYFSREQDAKTRDEQAKLHAALVQRVLASNETPSKDDDNHDHWPREDIFCGHDHDEVEE